MMVLNNMTGHHVESVTVFLGNDDGNLMNGIKIWKGHGGGLVFKSVSRHNDNVGIRHQEEPYVVLEILEEGEEETFNITIGCHKGSIIYSKDN